MNYQKHYNALIQRAKNRKLDSYTETHHILPRCKGGDDSPENLVELTPEEHLIAHLLLYKINDDHQLLYAAMRMHNRVRSNKEYGYLRRKFSEMQRIKHSGPGNPMYGKAHSEQTIERMRLKKVGKTHSAETKQKHSLRMSGNIPWNKGLTNCDSEETKKKKSRPGPMNGMYGKTHTDDAKKKIGLASLDRKPNLGIKWSDDTKEKLRIAAKNREAKCCEYCNKLVSPGNYTRWHGDKCKKKEH